jgi:hypothetical protein
MRKVCLLLSITFLVLYTIHPSTAFTEEPSSQDRWKFGAEIYLWGASVGGESTSGRDIDIGFDDILSDLEFGFMAIVGARKNNWSFLTDVIYLDVKKDDTIDGLAANAELRAWIVTPDVGYTVLRGDRGHLDLHVGARYLHLQGDVRLGSLDVDGSDNIWDGIIGIRGRVNFTDNLYLPYYLDVGTGQSELTWQAFGGLGYHFKYADVIAGYRYLEYKFDDNPVFDNLNLSGPYAGVKFIF